MPTRSPIPRKSLVSTIPIHATACANSFAKVSTSSSTRTMTFSKLIFLPGIANGNKQDMCNHRSFDAEMGQNVQAKSTSTDLPVYMRIAKLR
eukprot:961290-Amphidinium_carterae.1